MLYGPIVLAGCDPQASHRFAELSRALAGLVGLPARSIAADKGSCRDHVPAKIVYRPGVTTHASPVVSQWAKTDAGTVRLSLGASATLANPASRWGSSRRSSRRAHPADARVSSSNLSPDQNTAWVA